MRKFVLLCLVSLALSPVAAAQSDQAADRDAEIVYRIVSAQPVNERHVVFRSVTPEIKAALWRVHLRHFLDTHPGLSEAERTVIAQFITVMGADLYRSRPDDPEWEALIGLPFARMKQSASAILAPELYREALAVLGPPDSAPVGETVGTALTSGNAPSRLQPDCIGCGGPPPDCECNMGDDWCGWGRFCFGDNCKSDTWGCGTAWQAICNGMCR